MSQLNQFSRRQIITGLAAGMCGFGMKGWQNLLADELAKEKRKHCILLWMNGGPSQLDTFDMKPDHENGGEFKPISTNVAGLQISEHLPKLARHADQLAIIRSLSTKEGDHGRGTYLMRTGHAPGGVIQYPTIGSAISKQLGDLSAELPNYVSIAPYRVFNRSAFQPGFLGPQHSPLTVGAADTFQQQAQQQTGEYAELGVDDLNLPAGVKPEQMKSRQEILQSLQQNFVDRHQSASPQAHRTVYERAHRMMSSKSAQAFDLSLESKKTRDAYGPGRFGQGCLMARRLIEQGVPFVEVTLGRFGNGSQSWDTHRNNFESVKSLSSELDAGWGSLMTDLKDRGLLESTTIIWMGEFGRTPVINRSGGRDHYPKAWSAVLAGGGIKGGQAFGKTSDDGGTVEEGEANSADLLATLCAALNIDPETQNMSSIGRPINLSDGKPISEVLIKP